MKVSLVTTVRNEAHGAAELVRSIGAQTRPPDQWLVVDGGSTDDTVEIFAAEPSCTVITEPGNIAHGRNVGIARAEWPVVAVIDAGCVAEPAGTWGRAELQGCRGRGDDAGSCGAEG